MAASTTHPRETIYRHTILVRATHWINALALFFLLASGMQIFNAHPELYWGQKGANIEKPFISMRPENVAGQWRGITRIGDLKFDTTGFLGVSKTAGTPEGRGFPSWLTIPSYRDLATGRRWHFFFAWVFVLSGLTYLVSGFATRHIQRDLALNKDQTTWAHLRHEIVDHARLRFPKGEEAKRYNALQKGTYLGVIFFLLPMMGLTGMTMSPGVDAAAPFLLDLFGGRQSARTLHFICAALIVGFIAVHLILVLVSGLGNNLRSMITGRYEIEPEKSAP